MARTRKRQLRIRMEAVKPTGKVWCYSCYLFMDRGFLGILLLDEASSLLQSKAHEVEPKHEQVEDDIQTGEGNGNNRGVNWGRRVG